jgi:hypothetical protein
MPAAPSASAVLAPGSAVLASTSLRGVPAGTAGKVIHVQGLAWTRYWVLFENGLRVGTIDRSKLATPQEWERRSTGGGALEPTTASGTAGSGTDEPSGAPESVGGVPGYLLERSRKARERWAAKAAG